MWSSVARDAFVLGVVLFGLSSVVKICLSRADWHAHEKKGKDKLIRGAN